jgi:molecular chaperone DnaK
VSAFGIDFGTTTTAAAELDSTGFRDYGYGQKPLSSTVALDLATGEALVGADAKEHIEEREAGGSYKVIRSVKTVLTSGDAWRAGGRKWTAAMITAEVLKSLNKQVSIRGGIRAATFSVPVDVRPAALKVLRDAARIAGIDVKGIIKESTAAVFRHLDRVRACRYVAVFDWGGGTLDVSVLEIRGGVIYERYTKGMAEAGDKIDEDIARRVHTQLVDGPISFDDMHERDRDELRVKCERAKCDLSKEDGAYIQLQQYAGRARVFHLTRSFCRPAVQPLATRAIDLLAFAISGAGLSADQIDQIIVIGGSSRLWLLRELFESDDRFASSAYFSEKPEWDVARGAAVVDHSPGCYAVAETIGLELSDGSHFALVRPGDRIDGKKRSISLALVEDVRAANVVLVKWGDAGESHRELADQFTVETQGFDQEAVDLSWQLTEDLTLAVYGRSKARGLTSEKREITPIRFGYDTRGEIAEQSAIAVESVSRPGALAGEVGARIEGRAGAEEIFESGGSRHPA